MSLHIAQPNKRLNIPVTIDKTPMMRFIFVSVERVLGDSSPDKAGGFESARLWLDSGSLFVHISPMFLEDKVWKWRVNDRNIKISSD